MGDGRGFWSVGLFLLGLWGLSSLGLRGCFSSLPLLLGYYLGFLACVFCGPCVVHAVSWGLRSSEPGGWLWCFWSVFSFPLMRRFVEIHYDLFEHYFVHGWEMALHSL